MLSTVNTEYKFRTETTSRKRRFGGRKTTTKTWMEDNTYANPVELTSGGYILINYREKGKPADNKGIFAQGVNFNAKKGIIIFCFITGGIIFHFFNKRFCSFPFCK